MAQVGAGAPQPGAAGVPHDGAAAPQVGAAAPQPQFEPQEDLQQLLLQPPIKQPPWHFLQQGNNRSNKQVLQQLLQLPQAGAPQLGAAAQVGAGAEQPVEQGEQHLRPWPYLLQVLQPQAGAPQLGAAA